ENATLRPTQKRYDALDRILSITFPDNSVITKSYGIEGIRTIETVTDPLGNITETYKDIRGNIAGIKKMDSSGTVLTFADYDYNVLGELLKVSDAKGSDVTFGYDIRGRRKTIYSPETGLTEFWYDKADHLIRKVDANLRNNGAGISYIYDTLGRIEKIDYPFMEDTIYTYGAEGASYNRAGRIVRITGESGVTENYYGKLGETARVSKTIKRLTPLEEDKTAAFNYTFDYQGRMDTITYPDGEVVSYTYNRGGEVEKVSSVHNGLNTTYIEDIGYDEYGQRAYIKYGNGIETNYSYDEDRRWLKTIETSNTYTTLQDIDYTFDRTGNILSITNISGKYTTAQNYEYDGLYQLTRGEGNFEDREFGYVGGTSVYTQNFSYDTTGNILTKTSSNTGNMTGGADALNYNLEYTYYADKPKQAEIIGNLWYLYDSNGNIIEEQSGGHSAEGISGSGTLRTEGEVSLLDRGIALTRNTEETDNIYKRTYQWDEENRLKTTIDPAHTVEYRYDSTGERTNKRSGKWGETLYFNSMWLASEENYDFRQSKNIYLGETRIATRLNMESDPSTGYEAVNTYYYHPDHLGSSNIVTTPDGEVFEHIEYTPYGETWIEKTDDYSNMLPYKFTAKELDSETGLYYYGARYLNPRTSRWISADPAGVELINPNRDGFNFIESQNWYSYVGNNPVIFIDPNGMESADAADSWHKAIDSAPDFSWPVENGRVTSASGAREGIKYKDKNGKTQKTKPIHSGIDIAPETPGGNETFNYIGSGEISDTGNDSVRGNFDSVDHGDGWTSSYFHEDLPSLYEKGNSIDSSNKASMGSTGASTNTHLHLELRKNGELMDPSVFLGKRPSGMLLTPGIGETSGGVLYNEKK
ncbi:MAG: peptidoglycan DD-metalloendopeptidase family protein, partial [Spirochaetales bacterium]|nr:peptidoglycan DD-metalloendopeptidase family protein [Spirochaetales bacterium]